MTCDPFTVLVMLTLTVLGAEATYGWPGRAPVFHSRQTFLLAPAPDVPLGHCGVSLVERTLALPLVGVSSPVGGRWEAGRSRGGSCTWRSHGPTAKDVEAPLGGRRGGREARRSERRGDGHITTLFPKAVLLSCYGT